MTENLNFEHDELRRIVLRDFETSDERDAAAYEALIGKALALSTGGDIVLRECVAAGRRAGVSWSTVGNVMGISKQAAQQKFGMALDHAAPVSERLVIVKGVTAIDEMARLTALGKLGNELVGVGPMRLYLQETETVWAYRRTIGRWRAHDAGDDWAVAASWFPFVYHKMAAGPITEHANKGTSE